MVLTFRNIIAFFFAIYLMISGKVRKAVKRALKGEYILSIYFHNPSEEEFESIVKWFIRKKFRFISLSELIEIMTNRTPFPEGAVLISVDDGWKSNEANIVKIANKYQIPVAIFISTEPVEEGAYWWSYAKEAIKRGHKIASVEELKRMSNQNRVTVIDGLKEKITLEREAMTPKQVQRISKSKYITIGGHTHTHPVLTNCSEEVVKKEMSLSREKLMSWTGKNIEFFAYPNGDFSPREVEILKELRYTFGFANNPQYLTKEVLDNEFAIPRIGFLEGASFAENICRVVGVWKLRKKRKF